MAELSGGEKAEGSAPSPRRPAAPVTEREKPTLSSDAPLTSGGRDGGACVQAGFRCRCRDFVSETIILIPVFNQYLLSAFCVLRARGTGDPAAVLQLLSVQWETRDDQDGV